MNQFNEPWTVPNILDGGLFIEDASGNPIAGVEGEFGGACYPIHTNKETLERIVACVNFCREFDTDFIASRTMRKVTPDREWQSLADIPAFDGLMVVGVQLDTRPVSRNSA